MGRFRLENTVTTNPGSVSGSAGTASLTCADLGIGAATSPKQRPRIRGLRTLGFIAMLVAAALLPAKGALADYLGTSPAQVVVDPRDIAAVLADGLQTGDQFRLIGAVTPGNTGSNSGQSGWNTFYTIPGMRVTRVEIVDNADRKSTR